MIPIKIVCECGQRYAFDVEPQGGGMPAVVSCPTCGADGTAAANAVIAGTVPTQPGAPVASGGPLRVNFAAAQVSPQPVARENILLPGQVNRSQAEHEAKAKISWGDSPNAVVQYLMLQGFGQEEATMLVNGMFQERAATIRRNGIMKILGGSGLVCVPIAAFFIFMSMKYLPLKLFAVTIAVGFFGGWIALSGIFMVVSPKSEDGDVAEQ